MFSTSHLFVQAILDEKRANAAAERLASKPSSAQKVRLGAAARSVWSLLSGPAERPVTPTLTQYPYRG